MNYRRAEVKFTVEGLDDDLFGRVADHLFAANEPGIADAGLAASSGTVQVMASMDAGSDTEARSRLFDFTLAVLEKAGIFPAERV